MRWRALLVVAVLAGVVGLVALVAGEGRSGDDRAGGDAPPVTGAPSTSAAPPATATTAPTTSTAPPPTFVAQDPDCPPVPARAQPDPNRPRYDVALAIDPPTGVVTGDVAVRFTPDLPVDRLVLRLWANGPRPAGAGAGIEVADVEVDGRPAPGELVEPTRLVVPLDRPGPAGTEVGVRLTFRLEVPGSARDRISNSGGALRLGSFLPMLAWEPGVGWAEEPPTSGFAEATSSPAADWSVTVDVPEGTDVLATGTPDGAGRWVATAARDFALSAGRFRTATATVAAPHPVAVTVGVHDGIAEDPAAYLDRVVDAIDRFAAWYGPYPRDAHTLAITPGLEGGIEFPGHVMQGPGSIGRTTPHEVAHMWFYDLVGNNQARHPWLDEGLATWAEGRYEGSLDGFGARDVPTDGRGRAGEPMTYWEPRPGSYYRSVYVQTAVALASLAPPERIDCALAHHVARNAHRLATPDDLLDALALVVDDPAAALAPFGLP